MQTPSSLPVRSRKQQLVGVGLAAIGVIALLVMGSVRIPMGDALDEAGRYGGEAPVEEDPIATSDFGTPPDESEQADEEPDPDAITLAPTGPFTRVQYPFMFDDSNTPNATFRRNGGVHLITTFFKGTYRKRRVLELLDTLRRNILNPYFEGIHILWEDMNPRFNFSDPASPFNISRNLLDRLVTIRVNHQPTYRRFFDYANTYLQRGAIVIISNSDIYFDTSIKRLVFGAPQNQTKHWRSALALSRRHAPECGTKNDWKSTFDLCDRYIGSHDAFVFAPPVPQFILENSKHTQNHFGAENVIVWAFLWAKDFRGRVLNPCQRIRGFHLHCVQERHYEIGKFISAGRHGVSDDMERNFRAIVFD